MSCDGSGPGQLEHPTRPDPAARKSNSNQLAGRTWRSRHGVLTVRRPRHAASREAGRLDRQAARVLALDCASRGVAQPGRAPPFGVTEVTGSNPATPTKTLAVRRARPIRPGAPPSAQVPRSITDTSPRFASRKGKPSARTGRKATGLATTSQPGCRRNAQGLRVDRTADPNPLTHREAYSVFRSTALRKGPGLAIVLALARAARARRPRRRGLRRRAPRTAAPTPTSSRRARTSSSSATPCCACTTASAPATGCRGCARTRCSAAPPSATRTTWSASASSTTRRPPARRWSSASAAPATRSAPAAGRWARTSRGARAASPPPRRSTAAG